MYIKASGKALLSNAAPWSVSQSLKILLPAVYTDDIAVQSFGVRSVTILILGFRPKGHDVPSDFFRDSGIIRV